jgi:hypothetical protein
MVNVSAAMASEFIQFTQAMFDRLIEIGKNPLTLDSDS